MTHRFIYLLIIAAMTVANTARAGWSPQFGPTGFSQDGYVAAAVEFEGDLVVAGFFNIAGRDSARFIARWNGERWRPLGKGLLGVECLAVHDGRLYAGGKLTTENDDSAHGVACWDGDAWQPCSDLLDGEVHALASYRGELVVGGRFVIRGVTPIRHLARWNGEAWSPLGSGVSRGGRTRVEALEVHEDELVVAGIFGRAGQVETFHIARWDGRHWRSFGSGADDVVSGLRSSGSLLYAAGDFRTISGDSAAYVAVWDGDAWSPLGGGIRNTSSKVPAVNDLEVWRGELVVAGKFDTAGGLPVGSIATWNGREWRAEPTGFFRDPNIRIQEEVLTLAVHDGRLAAGGEMIGGAGFLVNGLGLWNGLLWDPLVSGQGIAEGVDEMKLLAGRLFMRSGGAIGCGNLHGTVFWKDGRWRPFHASDEDSLTFDAELKMFAEHKDRLFAFGKHYDHAPRDAHERNLFTWRLAEWDGVWRVVSPPLEAEFRWLDQLVTVGDHIVVLGAMEGAVGTLVHAFAWDGIGWHELDMMGDVTHLDCCAVVEGRLYLALQTWISDEPPRFSVVEWDGRRSRIIKTGTSSKVTTMIGHEGRLVASFTILTQECSESSMIQEWDGLSWKPWPGSFSRRYDHDASAVQLAVYDGHLVAAGDFIGVDALACRGVAYWDGGAWRPLGGGVSGSVGRLAAADSSLWFGGDFVSAGGGPSRHVARWDGPLPIASPIDSLPGYTPEERPLKRRGDGWHSHAMDMTAPPSPFANGDFRVLADSLPDRWEWRHSTYGTCVQDSMQLVTLSDGGVVLQVGADRGCACSLAQRFGVEGGVFYRVRARYKVSGEPGVNFQTRCRMTFADYTTGAGGYEFGPMHGGMWVDLDSSVEAWAEIILRVDARAGVGVVRFDARGPGRRLQLNEVVVDTLTMRGEDVTRLLIAELRDEYVPQSDRRIDWGEIGRRYTAPDSLVGRDDLWAVNEVLKQLEDPRVTRESSRADAGQTALMCEGVPLPKEDCLTTERRFRIRAGLMDCRELREAGGWTHDGIAFITMQSILYDGALVEDLADAEGVLIDLRDSGRETWSRQIEDAKLLAFVGHFANEPGACGYRRPSPGGRSVADTLWVRPSADRSLGMPVVCLIGQGCSGAGTEFAMMMKNMPNVTLVGRPTRGGTGGMARFNLPIGSQVNFPSRSLWSSDHELVNDSHGLQPDILVEPDGSLDLVFDEGLRILREKIMGLQQKVPIVLDE